MLLCWSRLFNTPAVPVGLLHQVPQSCHLCQRISIIFCNTGQLLPSLSLQISSCLSASRTEIFSSSPSLQALVLAGCISQAAQLPFPGFHFTIPLLCLRVTATHYVEMVLFGPALLEPKGFCGLLKNRSFMGRSHLVSQPCLATIERCEFLCMTVLSCLGETVSLQMSSISRLSGT